MLTREILFSKNKVFIEITNENFKRNTHINLRNPILEYMGHNKIINLYLNKNINVNNMLFISIICYL